MSPAAPLRSVVIMMTHTPTTTQTTTQTTQPPRSTPPPRAPRFARARNLPLAVSVRVLLTVLAMTGASFGAAIGTAAALGPSADSPAGSMTVFAVVCAAGTLLAWGLRRFFEGDRSGYLAAGWDGGRALGSFGLGLLAATLAVAAARAVSLLSGRASIQSVPPQPLSEWLIGIVLMIGVSVLLQGVPEEMLWRGYFQTTVAERLRPWTAAVIGSVGFGSMHLVSIGSGGTWVSKLVYVLMAMGLGLACAGLRVLTGSLWAAAGFHGGMHIVNRTLSIWIPEGQDQASVAVLGAAMGIVFVACWVVDGVRRGDRAVTRTAGRTVSGWGG